jgi:hypothetical protein
MRDMGSKLVLRSHRWPAVVLCALAVACSSGTERDDEGNVTDAGDVGAFDLRPGDCFNDTDNEAEEFESLRVVPCDDPHDNEIYASFDYPADDGEPFPGIEAIYEFGEPECFDAFEAFVGSGYDESEFDFDLIYPIQEGWDEFDDRTILCYLWQFELEKIEGSAEGTRR